MAQRITFQTKTIWHFRKYIKLVRKLFMWEVPESGYKWFKFWLVIDQRWGSSRVHTFGPLLFIICINDIVQDIDAQIKLFADDTSLYLVVDDPIETAETINGDLDKIHIWSEKWLVKFNPQKTETMILSKKNNKPNHPSLKMNNSELQK